MVTKGGEGGEHVRLGDDCGIVLKVFVSISSSCVSLLTAAAYIV